MEKNLTHLPSQWRLAEDTVGVKHLIDVGVILNWREMKRLRKIFNTEQHIEILQHIAERFSERLDNRLSQEIIVESLLVWLAHCLEEHELFGHFVSALFQQPDFQQVAAALVELSITTEISDQDHAEDIFAIAVALICELGLAIQEVEDKNPGVIADPDKLLGHVSTYLLSVSNSSNICIRLSLINYFGITEQGLGTKMGFNRIMGRFGHTVLEHLFGLLFNKKTEAVALQYLMENIPFVLAADTHCQKILHETLKYYMLKIPDRFALFVQTFTQHLNQSTLNDLAQIRKVYLQHLSVLLRVASEVNHKILGREILCAMVVFKHEGFANEIIEALRADSHMRDSFRELLNKLLQSSNSDQVVDSIATFRTSKRGRKPSFAKTNMTTLHQVTFLGQQQTMARAS